MQGILIEVQLLLILAGDGKNSCIKWTEQGQTQVGYILSRTTHIISKMGLNFEPRMICALYTPEDNQKPQLYTFTWKINRATAPLAIQSVDITIERSPRKLQPDQPELTFKWPKICRLGMEWGDSAPDIRTFLNRILREHNNAAAKLILPQVSGYVAQSNIIQARFHGCAHVKSVADFLKPGEHIQAFTAPMTGQKTSIAEFYEIFTAAIGAVSIEHAESSLDSVWQVLNSLEYEVWNRMGIQFLLDQPVPRKRIGLVQCIDYRMSLELLSHLNIELVVFDEPGTCMEDPNSPLAYLRESFHPIDLSPDDGFTERLYCAARDQRLDGLTTRFDPIFEKVAQVAERLNLPTEAPSAMKIATNKYLTRTTCAQLGHDVGGTDEFDLTSQAIRVDSMQELKERLQDPENPLKIPYPVVVKPINGWGSYGVSKAEDKEELLKNVEWAAGHIKGWSVNSPVMIEPYCDGPEVDINLAMWEGEITFFDVCDNAPTAGDLDQVTGSGKKDFQEGLFMYPSQLPISEQSMVREFIRRCILLMGFRSGVFHCEARVQGSSMHYVRNSKTGIIDLETKPMEDGPQKKPGVFLLEINARAPGYVGLYASGWNYGVDLWALHVLHSIKDEVRFRQLSKQFKNGPQHDSAVLLIMPEKKGILRSADPMPRLRLEKPELATCVPLCLNYFRQGEEVTPPDTTENCFTSVLLVESKNGRKGLMKTVEEARVEWTPVIA